MNEKAKKVNLRMTNYRNDKLQKWEITELRHDRNDGKRI